MNWNIGIDLGAHGARMVSRGRALVLRQASTCALRGEEVLALGDEARRMEGRAPAYVQISYPMRGGAIWSERALRGWLRYMISNGTLSGPVRGSRLLIARPPEMPLSQMRRISALALEAGASACALVRSDLAAALGSGVSLGEKKGRLIVQVGAGAISATLEAGMRVVACEALPYGLDRADEAVVRMLRAEYGLRAGRVTAQSVKESLASAMAGAALTEQATGLDVDSGFPRAANVEAAAVARCVQPVLEAVPSLVCSVMDRATPELMGDLIEAGVVLTGGGAQTYALDKQVSEATGLTCRVAQDPEVCVANGLYALLDAPDEYAWLVEAHQTLLDKRLAGSQSGVRA